MGLVSQATAQPATAVEAPQATPGVSATAPVQGNEIPKAPAPLPEGSPVDAAPDAPGDELTVDSDDLNPEEREAYDAAMNMVSDLVYADDEANTAIMDQLEQADPINSVAEVTVFMLDQIEQAFQGNLPETIVIPVADEVSDLLLELMETKGLIELDEQTYTRTKAVMVQSLFDAYGVDDVDMEEVLQGLTDDDVMQMKAQFGGE